MPLLSSRRTEIQTEENISPSGRHDAWLVIDKTVRKVDEDKVRDHMDDIDTLLVFAGLYSAVLTAFLIESYKNLQPDRKEQILLRIASQTEGYTFNGGHLNSTFTSSQMPPFQIALSDVRVNVCWFASLILSLSSASYGILVKQWLREYLAIDRTAPHERIRIRHFRAQGLEDWKLFEIAAALPVILQISLTLFFVGLCFFTAAVHPSIGHTSLGLVGGWAFFFILAVLAPLVSARCPYKTTFLKVAFHRLRPRLRQLIRHSFRPFSSLCVCIAPQARISTLISSLHRFSYATSSSLSSAASSVWHKIKTATVHPSTVHLVQRFEPAQDVDVDRPGGRGSSFGTFEECFLVPLMSNFAAYMTQDEAVVQEEGIARSSEANDLVIFRQVDSLFMDDSLLFMMREALQRRPQPGEQVVKFVVEVMSHRSDIAFGDPNISHTACVPWPWALSLAARTSLLDMLADSLSSELARSNTSQWSILSAAGPAWAVDALQLIFVLSTPSVTPSKTVTAVLAQLLQQSYVSCWMVLGDQIKAAADFVTCNPNNWSARVFTCLAPSLALLPASDAALSLEFIVDWGYLQSSDGARQSRNAYTEVLAQVSSSDSLCTNGSVTPEVILILMEVACTVLRRFTLEDEPQAGPQFPHLPETVEELIHFIFGAISTLDKLPGVVFAEPHTPAGLALDKVLIDVLMTPHLVHLFLEVLSGQAEVTFTKTFRDSLMRQLYLIPPARVNAILMACSDYFSNKFNSHAPLDSVPVLTLCYFIYMLPTGVEEEILETWHSIFRNALCLIHRASSPSDSFCCRDASTQSGSDHTDACKAAYAFLVELDADVDDDKESYRHDRTPATSPAEEDRMYALWAETFDVTKSQVPDSMVDVLRHFVCDTRAKDSNGRTFWRVRRLGATATDEKGTEQTLLTLPVEKSVHVTT